MAGTNGGRRETEGREERRNQRRNEWSKEAGSVGPKQDPNIMTKVTKVREHEGIRMPFAIQRVPEKT
eukprot:jgi/Botrbrau1/22721/Bobra.0132s0060.1